MMFAVAQTYVNSEDINGFYVNICGFCRMGVWEFSFMYYIPRNSHDLQQILRSSESSFERKESLKKATVLHLILLCIVCFCSRFQTSAVLQFLICPMRWCFCWLLLFITKFPVLHMWPPVPWREQSFLKWIHAVTWPVWKPVGRSQKGLCG